LTNVFLRIKIVVLDLSKGIDLIKQGGVILKLRDYQLDWIDRIYRSWADGNKYVIAQLPTGTGKTISFCTIAVDFANRGKRVLILTHREELLFQAVEKLLAISSMKVGIIKSRVQCDFSLPIQVASIGTLINKINRLKNIDLIIIDECHHSNADSWKNILESFPNAFRLGVTATPVRLDKRSFRGLFDDLLVGISVKEAIDAGHLSKYKLFASPDPMTIEGCLASAGDYRASDLAAANNITLLAGNLIDSYRKFAPGKQGIVFAVNIEHSLNIAQRYTQCGISAVHVDGDTPKSRRLEAIKKFKTGEIQILTNCNLFSEGVDLPAVGFVQIARPTKSLALYLQIIGRGSRPHPEKEFTVIVDHTRNYQSHGLPCSDRLWTLDGCRLRKSISIGIDFDREVVEVAPLGLPGPGKIVIENKFQELIEIVPELTIAELKADKASQSCRKVKGNFFAPSRSSILNKLVQEKSALEVWELFATEEGFTREWAKKNFDRFNRSDREFKSQRTKRKAYAPNQALGDYGLTYQSELPSTLICDVTGAIREKRRAMLACGFCESTFEADIDSAIRNKTRQCGCMIELWRVMTVPDIVRRYKLPKNVNEK
jgi:superfamily II DNA or RNA helicase